jgi:hypothetical protein
VTKPNIKNREPIINIGIKVEEGLFVVVITAPNLLFLLKLNEILKLINLYFL